MDQAVRDYIDAIPADHRPLFDRLHRLIIAAYPDATVTLSYKMPAYVVGSHRLSVGAWKHGLSVYGSQAGRADGFADRHPGLKTSTGTIRLRPEDAATISDDELTGLVRSALEPGDG